MVGTTSRAKTKTTSVPVIDQKIVAVISGAPAYRFIGERYPREGYGGRPHGCSWDQANRGRTRGGSIDRSSGGLAVAVASSPKSALVARRVIIHAQQ